MILSLQEAKELLQIEDNGQDNDIDGLIRKVQSEIIERTNNNFKDLRVYVVGATYSVTGDNITDSQKQFLKAGFRDNMDICIEGSVLNNGHYEILAATEDKLTLSISAEDNLFDEVAGDSWLTITRVVFPKALKLIAIEMLKHYLDKGFEQSKTSESIGSYSASYSDYNKDISTKLSAFAKIGF